MKMTSTFLAKVCATILILYPALAVPVWNYIASDDYGLLAALFAANAGTAFFVGLVLNFPEFSHFTPRGLRLVIVIIAAASGLASAFFWVADEVGHVWLRLSMVLPFIVTLLVLIWFADRCSRAGTKREAE